MSTGPTTIFDKSVLEALSPDEAVWLGQFYRVNITPLFLVETLATTNRDREQHVNHFRYLVFPPVTSRYSNLRIH